MGYLIFEPQIRKAVVTILAGDVGNLNFAPQPIIPYVNPSNDYTIIAANLFVNDVLTQISSFGHFYLQYGPSAKVAIYDQNNGDVSAANRSNFIINMSHPPNQFGSVTSITAGDLSISCENPPTFGLGNGEIVVTVYYFNNF